VLHFLQFDDWKGRVEYYRVSGGSVARFCSLKPFFLAALFCRQLETMDESVCGKQQMETCGAAILASVSRTWRMVLTIVTPKWAKD
jgi:hypothetical protein